jgi:hypothetical protein
MRQVLCVLVALSLCDPVRAGVKRPGSKDVDAQQSAALFVGVRDFANDGLAEVPFAIDDAVDLAYEFAIDHDPILVPPNRVVMALSKGEPRKQESQRKLKRLLAAGASRQTAERSRILQLLEAQSKRVGRNGILIVSFATHGVSYKSTQHLLTPASRLAEPPEETITNPEISEILSRNDVPRSLILIDACRERLTRDGRAGRADPRSAFIRIMTSVEGQVVMSGAAAGGYAYDDDALGNGVFTASVIGGLRCGAAKDWHHFVTVETLYSYVSNEVLRWVRDHGKRRVKKATELMCEGQTRKMPLSICVNRTASASAPHPR